MYNNPYMPSVYNPQANIDRINMQMAELEKMKEQLQKPVQQPITQNFQLAPTNREVIRYASSIDEVQRDMVIGDTPYFSKDMSVVWIKNAKGEIKTYQLNEIIPKDDRDVLIDSLQMQISELRKEIRNAKSNDEYVNETTSNEKSTNVSVPRTSAKKQKQSDWYAKTDNKKL